MAKFALKLLQLSGYRVIPFGPRGAFYIMPAGAAFPVQPAPCKPAPAAPLSKADRKAMFRAMQRAS